MDNVTVRSKGARHPRASLQLSRLDEAFETVKRRVRFSDEMVQTGEAMERALTYIKRAFLIIALVTAFLIVAFGLLIAWVCLGLFAGVDNGWTAMDADCLELAARYR
ncbi:hypothetical protein Ctob_013817 [Chrysochromulina tobinii]|uniref:Uncharacterized protein n=1 Tax=Chrysochromulina tobinii TaxID=1460289 RepID=A0A0M0K4T8_9EUKA|nr:hypothetical protein Ctob_013817 [Chrysochromulina tobinii]|eukprot:KOO33612.1 hypothetical protein Ctob_013817 [Chrysochromulina sp. CCMP291]